MLLPDFKIEELIRKNEIIVKPFDPGLIGPASLDVRLGFRFRVFKNYENEVIDIERYYDRPLYKRELPNKTIIHYKFSDLYILKNPNTHFIIHPGEFVLASIYEYIKLPPYIAAQLQGRSSFARLGLIIHTSAGWVDPGYSGHLTLEIINVNKIPIKLKPLVRIAQLQFFKTESVRVPYDKKKGSKYVDEEGATESRISIDFKRK